MSSILDNNAFRKLVMPISVEQYQKLGTYGILSENTELIRGFIIEKMIKSPRHSWLVQRMVDWLRSGPMAGYHVRQEQPLTLRDSEPEPDVAVVPGAPDDYRDHHPFSAHLVIEVAISSEDIDREKATLYSEAGIDEYWIVLPELRIVEVYRQPSPNSGYLQKSELTTTDELCCDVLLAPPMPIARLLS
ncbi:MAG: Uma2 family endonuclease [Pirellulaceae bacterium]|nr:Uma2 family endonuclease [Pirellulaceae bacterium]